MKLKRNKKVWIGTRQLSVVWDNEEYHSSFNFTEGQIIIGCKDNSEVEIFSNLLHEITEAYYALFELRLTVGNGDYLFSFSHKEFSMVNQLIAKTISEFIL